jgi:hypothetical protein
MSNFAQDRYGIAKATVQMASKIGRGPGVTVLAEKIAKGDYAYACD